MDLVVPDEAQAYRASVRAALSPARLGLALARRAMHGDGASHDEALTLLEDVGIHDLSSAAEHLEAALAAAFLAEEVGRACLPVPIAALLAAQVTGLDRPVHAVRSVDEADQLVDHAASQPHPYLVDVTGRVAGSRTVTATTGDRPLAPFAGRVDPVGARTESRGNPWVWHELFSAWSTVGVLGEVVELCRRHLKERVQFGKPLAAQQSLQFRLVDAVVANQGLRELGIFTAWRLSTAEPEVEPSLTLRLVHLETIRSVMRHAHQIHGAIGFCFEHDLSIYSQTVQFRRYSPWPQSETARRLGPHVQQIPSIFT